ncbi:unnamed protein product [Caenorhabditis auriculariae]|uniref:P/Homo B domain-containing protein n=1 Tax=Caenorhabditis auriculariae TaxID=2777116 RepID=A0A8S1GMU0_9PELO|nr:unnamed protein product [Caenorhabditis auriculariae]
MFVMCPASSRVFPPPVKLSAYSRCVAVDLFVALFTRYRDSYIIFFFNGMRLPLLFSARAAKDRFFLYHVFFLLAGATVINGIQHDSVCDDGSSECPEPTHTVIRLEKRNDELAREIAAQHDMHVKGEPFMESHYFLYHSDEKKSRRHKRAIVERLDSHPAVEYVEEQRPRKRVKRDFMLSDDEPTHTISRRSADATRFFRQAPRDIPRLPFPDPLYKDQWYLHGGAVGGYDMNVRAAWLQGYAGRNVSVSILDDGIQRDHPDLAQNYDPLASTDINDHDDDPTPQNNGDNKHGTRCAGEVAALAGNNQCGVGVAFKAKIGGVRMLDGAVSDSVEAASLSLNQHHIDIYSASWGPEDDGKTFDGPGPLAREAFYRGIKNGRGGKGNIFVWASGNGGSRQDSCSADGYTTSVYTLSISSATYDNHRPWYLEECPSSIATTYSSADFRQPAIVTVDVPSGCTDKHTGTSASAPLAAGIIALALEANPELTWRDMQHIVLRTANWKPLENNPGWSRNGVGRMVSNKFGYGLIDGGALVNMAKVWKTVPEQHICTYEYRLAPPNPRPVSGRFQLNFTLDVNGCESGTPVIYLEHVQVHATVRYLKRGDLKLTLFSPAGTRSVLLPPRPQDFNANGFHKWPFLSVQQWGEDPRGTWLLMVESVTNNPAATGSFHDWTLLLYGTADPAQPGDPLHPQAPAGQSVLSRVQQLTSQKKRRPMAFSRVRQMPIPAARGWVQPAPFRVPAPPTLPVGQWIFDPVSQRWISFPMAVVVLQVVAVVAILTAATVTICRRRRRRAAEDVQTATTTLATTTPVSSQANFSETEALRMAIIESKRDELEADMIRKAIAEADAQSATEESVPLSFSDLTSAGNCHEECNGGCSEPQAATTCFSCKHLTQTLRNKAGSGFKCVTHCDDTYYLEGDKCKMCSSHCHTCSQAEICETCPGSQLLIDVVDFPHFDHGKCVDACPAGLVADYESNLVQARCIWKRDLCGEGYYINAVGKCDQCDPACTNCTAPGPMSCDLCAKGFGKGAIGYCRPCCKPGSTPDYHCEDCTVTRGSSSSSGSASSTSFLRSFFLFLAVIVFISCLVSVICYCLRDGRNQVDYTPLPHYNSASEKVNLGCESDDDDELFVRVPNIQEI